MRSLPQLLMKLAILSFEDKLLLDMRGSGIGLAVPSQGPTGAIKGPHRELLM